MLEFTNESLDRIKKLEEIRSRGIDPYPAQFERTHTLLQAKELEDGVSVKIAGRIVLKRDMGKLTFMHLLDFTGKLQVILQQDLFPVEDYKFWVKHLDMADYIGIQGETFTTHKGEKSVLIKNITLLTKALLPLPEKFHGIQDEETKFRKRYLDILMNEDTKQMVIRRGKYFNAMREFLLSKGFLEVDTPVLEVTTGGADANPFATHHNAFDIDVYMRISVGELWQKRLMVAGLEKTFEIGRIFRNEGVSPEHAQDYNSMEVYWSYANYKQMMQLMKDMYLHVVDKVYGTRKFHIRGFDIDFDQEWKEIDYRSVILEKTGVDIQNTTEEQIIKKLEELGAKYEAGNMGRLVDYLWKYCRKQIPGPAFLINEPKVVSPLAKSIPGNEEFTQRFHILIAGSEVGNGYSELNDPLDQKERFELQQSLRDSGDDEAQMADWEFVEALMHGMPPTAGFGVSERLFAFLEDKPIRETQIFPLMKPLVTSSESNKSQTTTVAKTDKLIEETENYSNLPSVDDGMKLVEKYATATKKHLIAVGYVMRYFADKLGKNSDAWQLVGMLHDIDRDLVNKDSSKHCNEDLDKICAEISLPVELVDAIKSHYHWSTGVKPDNLIRKYICATDELTGFIVAVAKMMPNKSFEEVKVSSVVKKIKDKTFASGVSREEVLNCETMLGIKVEDFIQQVLEALIKYKDKISV